MAAGVPLAACGSASPQASGGAGAGRAPSGPLGAASSVPVGGGKIFAAAQVVVTQPAAGDFKAFSTRCPHQGCAVSQISDGFIVCPCHNSEFSISTGDPVPGSPATRALASRTVSVADGQITVS